jgi:hypothetical protein
VTLPQFIKQYPDTKDLLDKVNAKNLEEKTLQVTISGDSATVAEVDTTKQISSTSAKYPLKTPEQHKLEVANVINEILSKRILKSKGSMYDDLENELRNFLNAKLGKLLGGTTSELSLTPEEIKFYKTMYKRAIEKGD